MSNIQTINLDAIEIFRISGSLWGGEAALKPEDLDPAVRAALPPKELASLGRKAIYPKESLKSLRSVRYRAYMGLRRLGVSIFGGDAYALDPAKSGEAVAMLSAVKADFEAVKADFLGGFQIRFDDWIAGVDPKWQGVIRSALPSVDEVAGKVSFGWQQFRLASPSAPAAPGDTLQEEVAGLGNAAFDQIADLARIAWNKQNGGWKSAGGWRAVPDALKMLIEKARNCSLFDPRLGALATALETAAAPACKPKPDAVDLCILKGLMLAIQDPKQIKELCGQQNIYAEACSIGAAAGFMPEPAPAQAASAPEPAPASVPEELAALVEQAEEVVQSVSAPEPAPAPAEQEQDVDPELAAMLGLLN